MHPVEAARRKDIAQKRVYEILVAQAERHGLETVPVIPFHRDQIVKDMMIWEHVRSTLEVIECYPTFNGCDTPLIISQLRGLTVAGLTTELIDDIEAALLVIADPPEEE